MHKIYICTFQIGKAQLGAKTRGSAGNIHRRNTTSHFIRSTSVEKAIKLATNQSLKGLINIRITKA